MRSGVDSDGAEKGGSAETHLRMWALMYASTSSFPSPSGPSRGHALITPYAALANNGSASPLKKALMSAAARCASA